MDAAPEDGLGKQREMLMGPGPGQMNLNMVKDRARELQAQIAATITEMRANPGGIAFDRVLERFSILNAQYGQLQREIRPELRFHIAHPLQVDAALANLVPHQLATKVLPEMEIQEHEFLKSYPTHEDGDAAVEGALVSLCAKPDAHNSMVDRLFQRAGPVRGGPLHEQSAEYAVIRSNSKRLQKAIKQRPNAPQGAAQGKGASAPAKPTLAPFLKHILSDVL